MLDSKLIELEAFLREHVDDDDANTVKETIAEIARLKEQLSHEWPAIEELTKEREMYRMRWLGSMTTEDAALIRAENERLQTAIKWALGEESDRDGQWFGDADDRSASDKYPRPFWWRKHLRKIAFGNEQSTEGSK